MSYANPPVVEAIVEIRAELPASIDHVALKAAGDVIRGQYPEISEQRSWEGVLAVNPAGAQTHSRDLGIQSYLCWSADRKQAVRLGLNGLSFSRLSPYSAWGNVKEEAIALWETFSKVVSPVKVTRLGVRYINKINIEDKKINLGDYFTVPPQVPFEGTDIESFLDQKNVGFGSSGIKAQTVLTIVPSDHPVTFLLDIDVWVAGNYAIEKAVLSQELDNLRAKRTDIFESMLTSKTKSLFS